MNLNFTFIIVVFLLKLFVQFGNYFFFRVFNDNHVIRVDLSRMLNFINYSISYFFFDQITSFLRQSRP